MARSRTLRPFGSRPRLTLCHADDFPWSGGPRPSTVTLKLTWLSLALAVLGARSGSGRAPEYVQRTRSRPSPIRLWATGYGRVGTRNPLPWGPSLGSASRGTKRPRAHSQRFESPAQVPALFASLSHAPFLSENITVSPNGDKSNFSVVRRSEMSSTVTGIFRCDAP